MRQVRLTIVIEPEGGAFVARCPEVDVASQGRTLAEARDNLREAVDLFFECADADEVRDRLTGAAGQVVVEPFEVTVG